MKLQRATLRPGRVRARAPAADHEGLDWWSIREEVIPVASSACSVDSCSNPARHKGADLCAKHYHRLYRHGSVDLTAQASGISVRKPRRYRTITMKHHPLAMANGKVYRHRMVLYDALGGEDPECYWCGKQLHWSARRGDPSCVHVDHLDGDTGNDERANLEPSCGGCNSGRGMQERSRALRAAGLWSGYDTVATLKRGGRAENVEARRLGGAEAATDGCARV